MKFVKYTLFPVIAGIVTGMLIATLAGGVKYLSWLSFGLNFGMPSPLELDLSILKITFGASININIAVILCITAAVLIAKKLNRR